MKHQYITFVYSLQLEGQVITSIDLYIYTLLHVDTYSNIKQGEFTDITSKITVKRDYLISLFFTEENILPKTVSLRPRT